MMAPLAKFIDWSSLQFWRVLRLNGFLERVGLSQLDFPAGTQISLRLLNQFPDAA